MRDIHDAIRKNNRISPKAKQTAQVHNMHCAQYTNTNSEHIRKTTAMHEAEIHRNALLTKNIDSITCTLPKEKPHTAK